MKKNNIAFRLAERLTENMLEEQTEEFNILYSDLFELLTVYILSSEIIEKSVINNVMSFLSDLRQCIDNQN